MERRPGPLDATAKVLALLMPPLEGSIDRTRRDLTAVFDQLGGRRVAARVRDHRPAPPLSAVRPAHYFLPRRVVRRGETTLRDLRMVRDTLVGTKPSPLVRRPPGAPAGDLVELRPRRTKKTAPPNTGRPIGIREVRRETDDAVTLLFDDPGVVGEYRAGQFLTLEFLIDGIPVRRAYSLSSAPGEAEVGVTVKRIPDGVMSGFIHRKVVAGATLRVLGPSGSFVRAQPERPLLCFAGGSGITPVYSIIKDTLARHPEAEVLLVYGSRCPADIIFERELRALAEEHPNFQIDFLVDEGEQWSGAVGQLDREGCRERITALGVDLGVSREVFLCGPEPMRDGVRTCLEELGVPSTSIREEVFLSPRAPRKNGRVGPTQPVPVIFDILGERTRVETKPQETLLDAGRAAGLDLKFSCAMGGCGACKVRLVEGEVDVAEPNCLTREERADGYVLACVARAQGPCTIAAGSVREESVREESVREGAS
ncbi:MAG: ferredoxin--NADP reductase [Myxococcota bacterium]